MTNLMTKKTSIQNAESRTKSRRTATIEDFQEYKTYAEPTN